jgi:hypothetical protein
VAPRLDAHALLPSSAVTTAQRPPIDLKPAVSGIGVSLLAATIWRMTRSTTVDPATGRYTVGSWLLVGVYLGPIAAAGVALMASIGELATALAIRVGLPIDRLPTSGWLTLAVVVVLAGWQRLIEAWAWGNLSGDWLTIAGALAAAAVAMALSGQLSRVDPAR